MRRKTRRKKGTALRAVLALAAVLLVAVLAVAGLHSADLPVFRLPDNSPGGNPDPGDASGGVPTPSPSPPPPDIRRATIVAVGDIMAHLTQIEQAHIGDNRYDFSPSFELIAPRLRAADLAVGNLETTMAGPGRVYSGYPLFNTPADLAFNLKDAGFDLLCTANNHSLDMGIQGLKKTIEHLQAAGLKPFGTYAEPAHRVNPLLVELNGIRVAFLAYTFSTNGIPVPAGYDYAVNSIQDFTTIDPIIAEIDAAREKGADLVAIYMHWGWEYWHTPNDQQRDLARRLAEAGADLILGSHPHVIQPLEWLEVTAGGTSRRALVAYSMGNFISNQFHWPPYIPTPAVQYGLLVEVEIAKNMDSGQSVLGGATYEITWVHRNWRHRIIPCRTLVAGGAAEYNLTDQEMRQVEKGHQDMIEVVEKYGFSKTTSR